MALNLIAAESKGTPKMKSAEEWWRQLYDGEYALIDKDDIERIQKDAEAAGYARGLEHAASLIDASIYVKSENANIAKQIRALLPKNKS